MSMKWMKPNEGRLHKGNPFKSIEKAVKTAASQVSSEAERTTDEITKVGKSAFAALTDPTALLLTLPTLGASLVKEGSDAYKELSQAERDENDAEIARLQALSEEERLIEEEKAVQEQQSQLVKERETEAKNVSKERAGRLGTGRRGLLYQGKQGSATGLSDKLGG